MAFEEEMFIEPMKKVIAEIKKGRKMAKKAKKVENKQIIIEVRGGVVEVVSSTPFDIDVIVRDYDIDGSEEDLKTDENGDEYIEGIW